MGNRIDCDVCLYAHNDRIIGLQHQKVMRARYRVNDMGSILNVCSIHYAELFEGTKCSAELIKWGK